MAARKTPRKKAVRKKAGTGRSAKKKAKASRTRRTTNRPGPAAVVGAVIDRELAGLSRRVESQFRQLVGGVDRAQVEAAGEAARLLREARAQLGRIPLRGNSELDQFLRDTRRDLSGLLTRIEKTVRPTAPRKNAARKKPAGKKATGKKKTARKPTRKKKAAKKPARKVARKKAPSRRR